MAEAHGLRLYRLKFYGSEAGVGVGVGAEGGQRNYILLYE